jgi:hypothetical protein
MEKFSRRAWRRRYVSIKTKKESAVVETYGNPRPVFFWNDAP